MIESPRTLKSGGGQHALGSSEVKKKNKKAHNIYTYIYRFIFISVHFLKGICHNRGLSAYLQSDKTECKLGYSAA